MNGQMHKIKSVVVKVEIEGQGVVNFDGPQGKFYARADADASNQKLAKTVVTTKVSEEGRTSYERHIKISGNCLRNAVFKGDIPFQSSHLLSDDIEKWPHCISSLPLFLRGWTLTHKSGMRATKKSPLTLVDAVQTCNAHLKKEAASTSGARTDTSFYEIDSIGNVQYTALGSIEMSELEFVSCDPLFDRVAFVEDHYPRIRELFNIHSGFQLPEKTDFFTRIGTASLIGERGILLSQELKYEMIVSLLERIQKMTIVRNIAWARTKSLSISFIKEGEAGLDFDRKPDIVVKPNDSVRAHVADVLKPSDMLVTYRLSTPEEVSANEAAGKRLGSWRKEKDEKKVQNDLKAKEKKEAKKSAKKNSSTDEVEVAQHQ